MELDRFIKSPAGRLTPILVREAGRDIHHFAFVPNPLEVDLALSPRTWAAAIDAAHNLGRLDALAKELLPNPTLIARPTIRREAMSTSALEGTLAPVADILSTEIDEELPRSQAVTEVLNFINATEEGIRRMKSLPISTRLACELQKTLVIGTPSDDWQSGKLRETQVMIGPYRGCSVAEATYIPPPPGEELRKGMSDWEKWIHQEMDLHPIIRVAAAHYQFEALHPFTDGNGRIGRLMAILQLIDYGLLSEPLINLSPYFERHSERYRHRLREVSTVGAFDEWITYFCQALAIQAAEAESRIHSLLTWREESLGTLRSRGMKGIALRVTEKLIEYPMLTVKHVSQMHGVSLQAANRGIGRLTEEGILEEITGRSYNRVFQAPAVMDILFGPTPRHDANMETTE